MMKQTLLWMCAAILTISSISLSARADDFVLPRRDLTITVPQLEPRVVFGEKARRLATLEAPILKSETLGVMDVAGMKGMDEKPFTFSWMRTNPDVKPYKFMDDLTFVGVPLFVAGIIAKGEKHAFRQNDGTRHVLLTDFKTGIDDYTQFFGPAMTVGLKLGGVEGRSDWGRFLASAAMSYGFMAGFVNGIKYTAKEMRPDGSTANSWPSGHTATAFVGATILHKEYGLTRSPWYSVAGYGVATATGVMRVLNNRHWISDVLSGAGIGIMSGELGYAFSDLIFKHRGLLRGDISADHSIIDDPSFFSVSMGMGFGTKNLDFGGETLDDDDDFHLKFRTSTAVAAEGAYFFNKYFGVGGRLRVNSSPINGWSRVLDYANRDVKDIMDELELDKDADLAGLSGIVFNTPESKPQFTIESDHLTEFAADLGVYFNLPLSRRFALGAKFLAGRSIMQELNLSARYQGNVKQFDEDAMGNSFVTNAMNADGTPKTYNTEWDYFTLDANNTFKFGSGLSLTYAYKDNFAWKLFFDYDVARKTYTLEYNPLHFMREALPDYFTTMDIMGELIKADPTQFSAQDIADYNEFSSLFDPMSTSIKKNRHTFIIGGSFVISF